MAASETELVKFTIPERRLWGRGADPVRKQILFGLLKDCFGIERREIPKSNFTIVCRLDQFGRFIVVRDQAQIFNYVAELRAEIIVQYEPESEINVADR